MIVNTIGPQTKGWISPTGTVIGHRYDAQTRPYHLEILFNRAKEFGVTQEWVLEQLSYTQYYRYSGGQDFPKTKEDADNFRTKMTKDILSGRFDIDLDLQNTITGDKGFVKFYIGKSYGYFKLGKSSPSKLTGTLSKILEKVPLDKIFAQSKNFELALEWGNNDSVYFRSASEVRAFIKRGGKPDNRTEKGKIMAMFRENKKPMKFSTYMKESKGGFEQLNNIAKREDLNDLAQSYRKIVKTLKTKPGHEIVLVKTKEDEEYSKRTGIGDGAEVKIQKISGHTLGKTWTVKAGKREFTYEVIAINENLSEEKSQTAWNYVFPSEDSAEGFRDEVNDYIRRNQYHSPVRQKIKINLVGKNVVILYPPGSSEFGSFFDRMSKVYNGKPSSGSAK
jgi:hypothetical protein